MRNEMNSSSGSQEELAKELGLKEALTIGVGTMIGAGSFVLPRLAIDIAGRYCYPSIYPGYTGYNRCASSGRGHRS